MPLFNDDVDRNVITVDGIDWLHRTGASPPDNPVQGDLCRSRSARPFLIEATFAHEYQHLLQEYQDDREVSWINEGLSMYAEQVTGYTDLRKPVTDIGFSGSVQCFLGNAWNVTPANPNPTPGGPENSLTALGRQGRQPDRLRLRGGRDVHALPRGALRRAVSSPRSTVTRTRGSRRCGSCSPAPART